MARSPAYARRLSRRFVFLSAALAAASSVVWLIVVPESLPRLEPGVVPPVRAIPAAPTPSLPPQAPVRVPVSTQELDRRAKGAFLPADLPARARRIDTELSRLDSTEAATFLLLVLDGSRAETPAFRVACLARLAGHAGDPRVEARLLAVVADPRASRGERLTALDVLERTPLTPSARVALAALAKDPDDLVRERIRARLTAGGRP